MRGFGGGAKRRSYQWQHGDSPHPGPLPLRGGEGESLRTRNKSVRNSIVYPMVSSIFSSNARAQASAKAGSLMAQSSSRTGMPGRKAALSEA